VSKPKTSERGRTTKVPVAPVAPVRRRRRAAAPAPRRPSRAEVSVRATATVRSTTRPPWRSVAATLISLIGVGVATYLTIAHYSPSVGLACPLTGSVVNCEAVTTSKESIVFGIPVAVLGLLFFVPMLAISLPWAWRTSRRYVAEARLAMSVVGIGFVFYLVYAELFEIQKICLWCTSVHVLTFLLFVIVVTGWEDATSGWVGAAAED
jgi:uncharacterized membrane protein